MIWLLVLLPLGSGMMVYMIVYCYHRAVMDASFEFKKRLGGQHVAADKKTGE